MVELKNGQQQEMEHKLQFHSWLVLMAGSGSLPDSILSTLLKKWSRYIWVVAPFLLFIGDILSLKSRHCTISMMWTCICTSHHTTKFMGLVYIVMYVHPVQVVVLLCAFLYSTIQSTVVLQKYQSTSTSISTTSSTSTSTLQVHLLCHVCAPSTSGLLLCASLYSTTQTTVALQEYWSTSSTISTSTSTLQVHSLVEDAHT